MPSLFSLFVDLKANTAEFVSGMSTASYAAKRAGRDIEDSFSRLGGIATAALAPFGEIGRAIGETLSRIGEYASSASGGFAKLGGGMSAVAVGAGAAAGAMAAVSAGAIGIAVETAKSIDEMYHLAESSGVSVETLSKLSFVAKQYDIDQQSLAKGLQFMSAQMVKAATAGPNMVSAFDRLGVSVRGSNGNLKEASQIFTEVIGKLQAMQDRTAAVGLARQIFGRQTGAAVLRIPGTEEIDKWSEVAQKLNIVINEQTAEAAHNFETSLNVIKGAAQGVSIELEQQMLPGLQAIASAFVNVAENGNKSAGIIGGVATTFKGLAVALGFIYTELQVVTSWIAKTAVAWEVFASGAKDAVSAIAHQDFSGAVSVWKDTFSQLRAIQDDYLARGKDNWKNYQDFVAQVFSKGTPGAPEKKAPGVPAEPELTPRTTLGIAPKDQIADLVAKLAQQSAAELELAAAVGTSTAAVTLSKAAAEADTKILEERTNLLDKEKTLREQLANAKASQLPGDVAKYTAEIASVQKYLKELDADAPLIRERYLEIAAAKLATSTGEELGKETVKFSGQIDALKELVAAYRAGSSQIAAADIGKQLEADREKVGELTEAFAIMVTQDLQNVSGLAQLGEALLKANADLEEHRRQLEQLRSLTIDAEIGKQTRAFQEQLPALTQLADAYLHGADAVRESQVALKVADFKAATPGVSAEQIQKQAELLKQQSDTAYAGTVAQEAARYNLNQQYADEIEKLNQIRELLQAQGDSTLAVDAAIDDAQEKQIQQWDQAAIKVGTLSDRMQAFFNETKIQGDKFGEHIFSAFSKSIDDVSTQLARLVVTGKSSFTQMFEGLAESILKAQIQQAFGRIAGTFGRAGGAGANAPGGTAGTFAGPLGIGTSLAGALGVKVPGLGGGARADGSQGNPWYVVPTDEQGNVLADLAGKGGGKENPLFTPALYDQGGQGGGISSTISKMVDGIKSSISSVVSSIASVIGDLVKSLGSIFKGIGGLFGGFLAQGGETTPGKAYIVGEKHPEFFIPGQRGSVVPTLRTGSSGPHIWQPVINIYGATDMDSFNRSQSQIAAHFYQLSAMAHARNG